MADISTEAKMNTHIRSLQEAVGRCPLCNEYPDWFNDIPLKAFCWGQDNKPHPGLRKIVPNPEQPYGIVRSKTRWVKEIDGGINWGGN